MGKLSDEQIEKNKAIIEKLFETFPENRRRYVKDMFEGPVGLEYFTAPASSQLRFHNAFPGGLTDHSLRVAKNLRSLARAWCAERFPQPTLDFVALFHDFGKAGDGVHPYYIPNPNEWGRSKGFIYEMNHECVYMPSAELGLFVLQQHGVVLSSDEYLAIRLNDGMAEEANRRYSMKEPDLALLVHMADRWACSQEKSLS
jgi:hypothetical protein